MKLIYTLFFSLICYTAHAQTWALTYHVDFDTSDLIDEQSGGGGHAYFPIGQQLTIDTINYHHNQWQVGRPNKTFFTSAYSYPNAIVTDTLQACAPNDTSVFVLKLQKAAWLEMGEFSFMHRLSIDTGDLAIMELSPDTGLHWINVLSDTIYHFDFGYGAPKPDFSVSTPGWQNVKLFLAYSTIFPPSAVDSFLFRFTLITGNSSAFRDGWMMDNFKIGYEGEGIAQLNTDQKLSIYPDPVKADLHIDATNTIRQVTISNVLGQVLYTKSNKTNNVSIDVSSLPAGMYFIKTNGSTTGKFLKE